MASILHISDIHRTDDEPIRTSEILNQLRADLTKSRDEGVPRPDVVVVTGDITQSAEEKEYNEAVELLSGVLEHLALPSDRLVIVPGNHDVHWPTSEAAFDLRSRLPGNVEDALVTRVDGRYYYPRDEGEFQKRLANFRAFYCAIKSEEYPLDRSAQFTTHRFDDLDLAFAGFSSVDINHHANFRGRIHPDAIEGASQELAGFTGTRVAVFHHDLNWHSEFRGDTLDSDSVRLVSTANFELALCGHTHRFDHRNATYVQGAHLPIVSCGSLCAGTRARGDSVPRLYNVIDIDNGAARAVIHVREKRGRTDPWERLWFTSGRSVPEATASVALGRSVSSARSLPTPAAIMSSGVVSPVIMGGLTPFADTNARTVQRRVVLQEYVWTQAAELLDSDQPQIVIGVRGTGKTALLYTLTLEGRLVSPMCKGDTARILLRVGLMCPMRLIEWSAFTSKGWLHFDERTQLFSAVVATVYAEEMVRTVEEVSGRLRLAPDDIPSEREFCRLASELWAVGHDLRDFGALRLWLKRVRADVLALLAVPDPVERMAKSRELMGARLLRGGPGPIADLADELRRWRAYDATHWIVLFDEVEYLSDWQRVEIYGFLAHCGELVGAKIATLPYAHSAALTAVVGTLVPGQDYQELALSLASELEFTGTDEGTSEDFVTVANGLWAARVGKLGGPALSLSEVWPAPDYEAVLAQSVPDSLQRDRAWLERYLISSLAKQTAGRALNLLRRDSRAFSDQYWRRYREPVRFRLARELTGKMGGSVPLYWGHSVMLRACDGNCRRFLELARVCWSMFWSVDGLRPLTASEQDQALRTWARSVQRVCDVLPGSGPELSEIIARLAGAFSSRLYDSPSISGEALTGKIDQMSGTQAVAVAVGIAYGYLVPRLAPSELDALVVYPTSAVHVRLGFPIAVAHALPLRSGAVARIEDLRQVVFPWLVK